VHRDTSAGIFHIYTHCLWAVPWLYRDAADRVEFLRQLARVSATPGWWTCLAYCLMTSHYHLIVDVEEGALPKAMHSLNLAYARQHNRRYGLRGHVQFQRYGSTRIHDDGDLLRRFRYVARNPVEAGLCVSPEEWAWSSYAGTVGLGELSSFVDPAPLIRCASRPWSDPRAVLRASVERA
jgi:putative transposase